MTINNGNDKFKKVVIIGGSGFVGKYITKSFVNGPNTRILIVSRNPKIDDLRKLGNQILPPLSISITSSSDKSLLSEICKDAKLIVNLPGIMHETSENNTFENVHHQGARIVAKIAHQNNARLIHISAIGADPNSDIPYAKTKGLGEIAVREECPDAIIVRPSIVFGPEDDFFNRFAKLAKYLPVMPVFAGGKTRFQPVYVWDLAMAIVKADKQFESFKGKLFEIGGPKIYTYKQLIGLTLTQAGLRRPIISLPWSIGYLQGLIMERLPVNLFTITRDQVKLLRKDNVVGGDGVLTLRDLGIDPVPAEKILYTYLRRNEINISTQNKRIHRTIDRSIEEEIEEVNQIIKDMPRDALDKEAEYRKLHDRIDRKIK